MMHERRHLIRAPLRIAGVPDGRTRRNRAFAYLELRARVEQHHLGQAPSAGPRRPLSETRRRSLHPRQGVCR